MLEQELQKQIIDYLTAQGWLVWKNKNTARTTGKYITTGQRGVPDLTAIRKSMTIFIEVKMPGGVQSSDQKIFQQKIKSHGGMYFVLRAVEEAEILHKFLTTIRL